MIELQPTHSAWTAPEPEWVPLAPGVRWELRRPNGAEDAWIASQTALSMRKIIEGRAELEGAGFSGDELGVMSDIERVVGLQGLFAACHAASRCLRAWEGMEDPETGQLLEVEPETVRNALLYGPPPGGNPLLVPFLAWLEGPKRPMAAEALRLRQRARDAWAGGFERCQACRAEGEGCADGASEGGELCPQLVHAPRTPEGEKAWEVCQASGMWVRAGMGGVVTGLDYRAALLAVEAAGIADVGAAFGCLRAIEHGRLEAEVERAAAATASRDQES